MNPEGVVPIDVVADVLIGDDAAIMVEFVGGQLVLGIDTFDGTDGVALTLTVGEAATLARALLDAIVGWPA